MYDSTAITKLYTFNSYGSTELAISEYVNIPSGKYYVEVQDCYYSNSDYTLTILEKHNHIGTWVETLPPTCTLEGVETKECQICGFIETRAVEALDHDYNDGEIIREATIVKGKETKFVCQRCGEEYLELGKSKFWIIPVAFFGGLLVIIGLMNYIQSIKKKN